MPRNRESKRSAEHDPRWSGEARRALEPYFRGLDDPATLIVPIVRTSRLREDAEDKIRHAGELMREAAAGSREKRVPLEARAELDGTYTILDGKSTHANLERLGIQAVPLVVVEDAQVSRSRSRSSLHYSP